MMLEICIGGVLLLALAGVGYLFFALLAEEKAKNRMRIKELALFSYKKADEEHANWMAQNEARLARQLTKAAEELGYDCMQAELFGKKLAHEIINEWSA